MPINLANISAILLHGLRMTPEERDASKREADEHMAREGAAERAKYDAMSDEERREYDAMTYGMMPRLRRD